MQLRSIVFLDLVDTELLLLRYWWDLRSCEVGGVVTVEVLVGTEIL